MVQNQDTDKTEKKHKLKPQLWKKGESGNLNGRPKGTISILTKVKKYLKEHPDKFEELIAYYIDNRKMRELLWKMIDGMPRQSHEIGGKDGGLPVQITYKIEKNEDGSKED